MSLDKQLLTLLVCPITKAPVFLNESGTELICLASRLAYPIKDSIPIMLEEHARQLSLEEYEQLTAQHSPS